MKKSNKMEYELVYEVEIIDFKCYRVSLIKKSLFIV